MNDHIFRPRVRTTHTVVILTLSEAAFAEIKGKLEAAGYEHTFGQDSEHGETIDMTGIAVAKVQSEGPSCREAAAGRGLT